MTFPFWFALLTLVSVVAYLLDTILITEWRAKYFKMMTKKDNEYVQRATDALLNFETVKYFNAEGHEEDRYEKALGAYRTENVRVQRSLVVLSVSQSAIISIGLALNLLLANWQIVEGELNVGDFVLINTYILQLYAPLNFLGTFWRMIRQAMVDVEQIFNILDKDEQIYESKDPEPNRIKSGEIEFRNVSFSYDKESPLEDRAMILENVSFTIPAGKSVAIVGSTGSGKSTIMRLLYRFYEIDEGSIYIDG